jgi:hypothetical protein
MVHRVEMSGHSSSIEAVDAQEGTSTIEYGNIGLLQLVIEIGRRTTWYKRNVDVYLNGFDGPGM